MSAETLHKLDALPSLGIPTYFNALIDSALTGFFTLFGQIVR